MANSNIRVAIVGLGRMGSTIDDETAPGAPAYAVAAACRAGDRFEIVAGADIDLAKQAAFQARWGVAALYTDYLEMIRQEQPDLVAICTRGHLHAEMAVAVAEANVPMIYCEKAIACSMREADAILAAVGSRAIAFNSGVLRRFNRVYHQARDLIAAGEIGEVRGAVHSARATLLHGHIHTLDTLSFLLGDPAVESVWGELVPRNTPIEHNRLEQDPVAIFQATFAGGIETTTVPGGVWEFEVFGSAGSVCVLNNGECVRLRKTGVRRYAFEEVTLPPIEAHSTTLACLEDLADAHAQQRPTLGNIHVTHHITEACFAIAESHRQGQRVELPLVDRDLYIFHV